MVCPRLSPDLLTRVLDGAAQVAAAGAVEEVCAGAAEWRLKGLLQLKYPRSHPHAAHQRVVPVERGRNVRYSPVGEITHQMSFGRKGKTLYTVL